jgi:hypothetical protein
MKAGQREDQDKKDRMSGRQLEFITFTDPESSRSVSNRQRVRSQAMRDFHSRSDDPKRRRNEIELDISPLLRAQPQVTSQSDVGILAPRTVLDVSRMDPFFQYPIEMGYRERELYNHCMSRQISKFLNAHSPICVRKH